MHESRFLTLSRKNDFSPNGSHIYIYIYPLSSHGIKVVGKVETIIEPVTDQTSEQISCLSYFNHHCKNQDDQLVLSGSFVKLKLLN